MGILGRSESKQIYGSLKFPNVKGALWKEKPNDGWISLGSRQYGGKMVIRLNRKIVNLDPYYGVDLTQIHTGWMGKMFVDDWTLNPEIYDYRMNLRPNQYVHGHLAESWEFTDPSTFVVHLRKGIHWQDIPPAKWP